MFKKVVASRLICCKELQRQQVREKPTASFIWGAEWLRRTEPALAQSEKCTLRELMVRVGHALYNGIRERYPRTRHWLILVGTGNNGGDALEVARRANQDGIHVQVLTMPTSKPRPMESQAAMAEWLAIHGTCKDILSGQPLPLHNANEENEEQQLSDNCENNGKSVNGGKCHESQAAQSAKKHINTSVDLIIDGLLGTGISGAPRAEYVSVIKQVNALSAPVVAIDIPSGLNAETGEVVHDACINADYTMTFITLKPGLFLGKGKNVVGTLEYDDLNLTNKLMSTYRSCALMRRLTAKDLPVYFHSPRAPCSHKGHNSKVVLAGGDAGMGGAIIMATEAAVSVGAGLTKVITRGEHLQPLLSRCPEAMVNVALWDAALDRLNKFDSADSVKSQNNLGSNGDEMQHMQQQQQQQKELLLSLYKQGKFNNDRSDGSSAKWNELINQFVKQLTTLFEWADVIAVGPGLGTGLFGHIVVNCALEIAANSTSSSYNSPDATKSSSKTLIMDADALRILQMQQSTWRTSLPVLSHSVITPHPGEAAFLLGCSVAEVEADRISAARQLSAILGGVCVLKGAGSIVYQHHNFTTAPTNSNEENQHVSEAMYCAYIDAGNPGMGCGGMGDVLTGTITGLAAQPISYNNEETKLFDHVCAATLTHSVAADLVMSDVPYRGTRGVRPTELIPYLQKCINCTWQDVE